MWWFFNELHELGLLTDIARLNVEIKNKNGDYERTTFSGLPYVVRRTPSVEIALELAMNVGYESYYCRDSLMIKMERLCGRNLDTHHRLAVRFLPYWWYVRDIEDVRIFLLPHIHQNIIRMSDVSISKLS
mgnify:CR=1 FL=1